MNEHQRNLDDQEQVMSLCDSLAARADIMRSEEMLLADLVSQTATTRPYRSRQYALLLDEVRGRYERLRAVVTRFCHSR